MRLCINLCDSLAFLDEFACLSPILVHIRKKNMYLTWIMKNKKLETKPFAVKAKNF
ncbi:hypothetical protein Scep_013763 [Stephania cephalantha]|uniref:Uncharacterized protein n=1 Tax=Stephania cephalantha TaxID=152367 RepID=A0AAP0IZQ9_9MAGN